MNCVPRRETERSEPQRIISNDLYSYDTIYISLTEKNGFVAATKLGTTNNFFVAASKNFAAATKPVVGRTKRFVVLTKYFCYLYFNK